MMKQSVIAIDGPSGSGKSTIAQQVAKKLSLLYVDTGAMFRALGFALDKKGISLEEGADEVAIEKGLKELKFEYGIDQQTLVVVDGHNLTEQIREHRVSELASKISKFQVVRTFLADFQRKLAQDQTVVMEGRDIGTVIFPQAILKVFMHASEEERAKRRLDQLLAKDPHKNSHMSLVEMQRDLAQRDIADSTRKEAPLKKADDAIDLDTTELSIEQVVEKIVGLYQDAVK
jgi:cytidylate kinase